MIQHFPKPFRSFGKNISVKVDLSNYATKTDLKNVTHIEVDKLDIDKLVSVPVDLNKLSNLVKNEVVKKTVFDKLVAKVNSMEILTLVDLF